ncbi:pseudouridine synthase [Neisseria chenwenguii]|uniref:Dual-specificity RNA pseudouridine synthase RluF n=1 Tax=Neisseria chenwenguii TaxID=1853278 RepID=A0A220S3I0_9NEIS|nr:pseudouridine synthase [Neisseria chenwenguii]ASK28034.1 pseudouridylate synthase [Neisseria chenwenguii]ROV57185.1 rRNA pseudouridine synthase [Neisseria chenwenguii]
MQPNNQEPQRLSKRMAQLGLCSRREADSYIEKGWVRVNGQTAILGQKVSENDRIDLDKQAHESQAARVTILLNKPVGYVSAQAEKGYKSAAELITPENRWEGDDSRITFSEKHKFGLAPAGRLDIDSVGLLVLTQDGRTAKQLIGENSGCEKEYLVRVRGRLDDKGLALLNHGLSLDGEKLRPAKVEWQNEDQLRFVLKQGKKRQIRRMCELIGLRVVGLKRIRMGRVKLGRLPPGKWRYLRTDERF